MPSLALTDYKAALERLKNGKPENVPKGSAINNDTVAQEAGRSRGSIRNRPGWESLIEEIKQAGISTTVRRSKLSESDQISRLKKKLVLLERENDAIKSRYLSLLQLNYEMARKLRKAGVEVPQFANVTEMVVNDTVKN
jgi:hypothetical protein